jgi:uncharacterized membrane protein YidH (DUF202 family)
MTGELPPGLQAERTELAWERTAIGALASAVLLAIRVPAGAHPVALLPAGAALLLALTLAGLGRRRGRILSSRARPLPVASTAVQVVGAGTATLGALIIVFALR